MDYINTPTTDGNTKQLITVGYITTLALQIAQRKGKCTFEDICNAIKPVTDRDERKVIFHVAQTAVMLGFVKIHDMPGLYSIEGVK